MIRTQIYSWYVLEYKYNGGHYSKPPLIDHITK